MNVSRSELTGRIAHQANVPDGIQVIGASAIPAAGQMHTDTMGMQDYPIPVALSTKGIQDVINGYVKAAKNAMAAGFDGVELHAANVLLKCSYYCQIIGVKVIYIWIIPVVGISCFKKSHELERLNYIFHFQSSIKTSKATFRLLC